MYSLTGGVFLGWALGSNDAANVFGTAVASRIIRFRNAVFLASAFILMGAFLQGAAGMETLSGLTAQNKDTALIVTTAAAFTVAVMTRLRLPVSTSQAVIGAIIGMGLLGGWQSVQWDGLGKVALCWVGTPIGAAVIACIAYPTLAWILNSLRLGIVGRSRVLKVSLIVSGCWGAYALGANNVANVTGVFYGVGSIGNDPQLLVLIGGASIALGVITYSKGVMFTVGRGLVELDAFSALVAVVAQAATVHFYAMIGVPVSTSQAVVGAVLGIGILKGVKTINKKTLVGILLGWVSTPVIAAGLTYLAGAILL